jgi:hypothetical protein
LPFLAKVGSLTVVARNASDVLSTVDKFLSDDGSLEPVISTFEGSVVDLERLRGLVGDPDESCRLSRTVHVVLPGMKQRIIGRPLT